MWTRFTRSCIINDVDIIWIQIQVFIIVTTFIDVIGRWFRIGLIFTFAFSFVTVAGQLLRAWPASLW